MVTPTPLFLRSLYFALLATEKVIIIIIFLIKKNDPGALNFVQAC